MQRLVLDRPKLPRNRKVRACLQCRSCKLKCDRSKPSCQRCVTNNWTCTYMSKNLQTAGPPSKGESQSMSGHPIDPTLQWSGNTPQVDQTIWLNQAGRLTAAEDSQVRYYSSVSWKSALADSEECRMQQCPAAVSVSDNQNSPSVASPEGMAPSSSTGAPTEFPFDLALADEINRLVCFYAEFHQCLYPIVDIAEVTAALRDAQGKGSLSADLSALIAAMCYGASSSLLLSGEFEASCVEPSTWKDLSHRFLMASGYPLRPNINSTRAAFLLAASSMAEWNIHPDPTPIAVLVRSGQTLGLHRDPDSFQCTSREANYRRRLWWSIRALDMGYSVAHAVPPITHSVDSDVKMILDDAIHEVSMLNFLIHVDELIARILEGVYGVRKPKRAIFQKLDEDCANLVTSVLEKSKNSPSGSREKFVSLSQTLTCYKATFLLHQPYLRSASWPKESRRKALDGCINYIRDFSYTSTDPSLAQYRWILSHWNMFHACAVILEDLIQHPHSPEEETLRGVIESTFSNFSTPFDHNWKRLECLRRRAWHANQWSPLEATGTSFSGAGVSLSDWDPLFACFIWDDLS